MRNWARSLLVLAVVATPAMATPPQVIWVEDTLFAQGGDTLMILRNIKDNQGQHSALQTDTFLLTLSLLDGAVISVDAVQRAIDINLGEPDIDRTDYPELGDAIQIVNPYTQRASAGLAPLTAPSRGRTSAMIHPTGIVVFDGNDLTHRLTLADTQIQMERALIATRAALPILHSDAGDADLFDPTALTIARHCVVNNAMTFWQLDGPRPSIVNLFCEGFEDAGSLDIWVVLPETDPQ